MTAIDHDTANYIRVAPIEGSVPGFRNVVDGVTVGQSNALSMPSFWSPRALMMRFLGGSMVLASTGLWLVDGAGDDPQLALIRLGASIFLLFIGLVLMLLNDPAPQPEVQFDTDARELRVFETARRDTKLVARHAFSALSGVRFANGSLTVEDHAGHVVVAMPLADAKSRILIEETITGHLPRLS